MTPSTPDLNKLLAEATAGPWMVAGVRCKVERQETHSVIRYDETKKRDETVANVWYDPKTDRGRADARLIDLAPALAAEVLAIRAKDEAGRKAHEKEIAVWSENYAALERERAASFNLLSRAHKVLVQLDRICVDPVLDPLIDEMAALIFRAMQPRPSEYEIKLAQLKKDFPNGI